MRETKEQRWERIMREAHELGIKAAEAIRDKITPMVVENTRTGERWTVPEGPCGFAQVRFAARSGFAKWIRRTGRGSLDSYWGGIRISIFEYGQSMQLKEAYGRAVAQHLRDTKVAGDAYCTSQLD